MYIAILICVASFSNELVKEFYFAVMCMDFDAQRMSGVCGSPLKTLEVFSLSLDQVL